MESYLVALALWNGLVMAGAVYWLEQRVQEHLDELDGSLAAAIKGLLEAVPIEGFEPPNPIQQAIAGWLQQNIANRPVDVPVQVVKRDDTGRFDSTND